MSAHRLSRLPTWISHWLGYRADSPINSSGEGQQLPKGPNYVVWIWSFIGAFIGISILQAVFGHAQYFVNRNVPSIIASYPRALVGGHFISALIGVGITKLFRLSPHFGSLQWLAGSLSASISIVVMEMTGTTHPPAGATAILAAVNAEVLEIGWYFLPVILLSSILVLVSALLVNNIQRRYPMYWFKPYPQPTAKMPPAPGVPENLREGSVITQIGDANQVEAKELADDRV